MCENRQSIIIEIKKEAFVIADELRDINLDEISMDALKKITDRIFEHVDTRILQEFRDEDHSDSGENARRVIRICRDVARYINDQHFNITKIVEFDEINFNFVLS